jgi:hypothetical protein
MVDPAVIQHQDTMRCGIRIHYHEQAIQPLQEFIPVIPSDLYVTVDDARCGDRWQEGVANSK